MPAALRPHGCARPTADASVALADARVCAARTVARTWNRESRYLRAVTRDLVEAKRNFGLRDASKTRNSAISQRFCVVGVQNAASGRKSLQPWRNRAQCLSLLRRITTVPLIKARPSDARAAGGHRVPRHNPVGRDAARCGPRDSTCTPTDSTGRVVDVTVAGRTPHRRRPFISAQYRAASLPAAVSGGVVATNTAS